VDGASGQQLRPCGAFTKPFGSLCLRDDTDRGDTSSDRKGVGDGGGPLYGEIPRLIQRLPSAFRLLPDDPAEFVRETRVLPMETKQGFRSPLKRPRSAEPG